MILVQMYNILEAIPPPPSPPPDKQNTPGILYRTHLDLLSMPRFGGVKINV